LSDPATTLGFVLTTDQKGTIAEDGIAWAAIRLGIDVYKPLNDGTRCDLIFDQFNGQPNVQLRLAPTRNNQKSGINWAEDYEFDARLSRFGAVAQLGERDAGSVEAAGSSPAGSIEKPPTRRLLAV
jgi:hypothetical protein